MPRKRKRGQFDDYDDWQDAHTSDDVQPEQEVAKVSLEDFCVMRRWMPLPPPTSPVKRTPTGQQHRTRDLRPF